MAQQARTICLVQIHHEKEVHRHFVLASEFVMGRGEEADVQLPSNSASRKHIRVTVKNRGLWIKDLESSNGTKLGSRGIEPGTSLPYSPGERITFGDPEMFLSIFLFQTPLSKFDEADDIIQEAFQKAEAIEATSQKQIEEFKLRVESEVNDQRDAFYKWRRESETTFQEEAKRKLKEAEEIKEKYIQEAMEKADVMVQEHMESAKKLAEALKEKTEREAREKAQQIISDAELEAKTKAKETEERLRKEAEEATQKYIKTEQQRAEERGRREVDRISQEALSEKNRLLKESEEKLTKIEDSARKEGEKIKKEAEEIADQL
ncbi:MAG: FHA domain-containing protein, partial [Bdellovibrionales bacterium]|nr:FHA domain-containing protein [Bdellovibrionales bacterium]